MSRTLMPCAYKLITMSSSPPAIRPARLGTSSGSKLPARSRGTCNPTGPTPVCTVLAIVPLRDSPEHRPPPRQPQLPRLVLGPGQQQVQRPVTDQLADRH